MDKKPTFNYKRKANEELFINEDDSCMPNALNTYFGKRLFDGNEDFHKKQNFNFKLSKQVEYNFSPTLSKRVRYTESISTKRSLDHYLKRQHIFITNKIGKNIPILRKFLKKLPEKKFVLSYNYRESFDNGKNYKPKTRHVVVIEKKNGLIKTISDEGNDPTILPRIDFYLNGCPKNKIEDQLDVPKWVEGVKVKIISIAIYEYVEEK